jgi:hypothetical protein
MEKLYNIPIKFKEGTYAINELSVDDENVFALNYDEYGDIVTYNVQGVDSGDEVRLYDIPREVLDLTLKSIYDANGYMKMLTINRDGREELIYIHYNNEEDTKKEIEKFANENANSILEKIGMCKDLVSRLFIEFFNDGECMDFHVKLGTEAEKAALEKRYPNVDNICDMSGDYSSKMLYGDNNRLKIMVLCANNNDFDYFQYAVDIMVKLIEEKAQNILNKSDDFKVICGEYD